MVREIYPKGLQKIRNIQPLLSLVFGSVFFEVVGNGNFEVQRRSFLLPAVKSAEVREGDDTAVLEDFDNGH